MLNISLLYYPIIIFEMNIQIQIEIATIVKILLLCFLKIFYEPFQEFMMMSENDIVSKIIIISIKLAFISLLLITVRIGPIQHNI